MSLITRCPACGTMFKVVADQLKISQGWVRCGHCSEVFDAAAQLQPRVPQASAAVAVGDDSQLLNDALDEDTDAQPTAVSVIEHEPAPEVPPADVEVVRPPIPMHEIQVSLPPEVSADVFVSSMSPDPFVFSGPVLSASPKDSAFEESQAPERDSSHDVSFVREARRNAFWSRPVMRWSMGLATLVLTAALLLQIALFQRNTLVAWQPWLGSGLQTLCVHLHCEVEPAQQIESVVIDSSAFNKIGPDAYRLKVVIKNAGAIPLAMPSLELTLTDTQEQALLRRVLAPVELGAAAGALAAGAGFSGEVAIRIVNPAPGANAAPSSSPRPSGPLRIAGYRILAFYP